ncbi:PAS domain S-box protein [Candidatus Saganbacteria bacterium]|nr:PAS domain S-box protein [Candidatus Saganbacteria bacterium]
MIYYPLSAAINFLGSLYLGFFVLSKNKKSPLNITFSLFAFSVAFWGFGYFFWQIASQKENALFWVQVLMVGAILIPVFFFHFILCLLRLYDEKKNILIAAYLLSAFFLISDLTPFFVKEVAERSFFKFWPVPGPLFHPYLMVFIALIIYSHLLMFQTMAKTSLGRLKNQIKYIFIGTFFGFLGGTTNFLLWYNVPFPPIGNGLVMLYVAFTTYAIIKHRLMSIETVIQKGILYGGISVLVLTAYAAAAYFLHGLNYIWVNAILVLALATAYNPLLKGFQYLIDVVFYRERYDYQKTLREISYKISTQLRLEDLTSLIVSTFVHTMRVSEISFLILDKEKGRFRSIPAPVIECQSSYKQIEIDIESPIAKYLQESKDVLLLEELEDEIAKLESYAGKDGKKLDDLFGVKFEIEKLGTELWVPILSQDILIGIISLGYKLSGDMYSTEDMVLLMTLANQTAVALENARLYEEVLLVKNYTQDILEAMVSGVATIDMRGNIVTFNPAAEKITDLNAKEVIGKNYSEVFSKKSPLSQIIGSALSGRQMRNHETSIVAGKKGLVPISLNSSALVDANGKRSGIIFSMSDLTEMKSLEGKVRQADKIGALGTMAAGMAHEIKNPLSSMKVLSQLLPIKYEDTEFRQKFIEIMPREILRIDRIVESLLGFARAATPKFTMIDLNKIIDDDVRYFNDQAKTAGVKIITAYADIPQIEGDSDQLSQVFSNLILNALQAMPEGGEIKIKTREGKKIENILQTVEVEVSDSGHGISGENIKKLFDPFFTTKYAGTGLGLTITHSIIDGHRGLIDVSSKAGRGTTFIVTLPVSQELV